MRIVHAYMPWVMMIVNMIMMVASMVVTCSVTATPCKFLSCFLLFPFLSCSSITHLLLWLCIHYLHCLFLDFEIGIFIAKGDLFNSSGLINNDDGLNEDSICLGL